MSGEIPVASSETVSEPSESALNGVSIMDGVGLIAGAAVASVHIRSLLEETATGPGWIVGWGCFTWIAVSAAGPFVYAVRRSTARSLGPPQIGDRLWGLIGLPWLFAALCRSMYSGSMPDDNWVGLGLAIGLAIVSFISVGVVWANWVNVDPERATKTFSPPWTNKLGLFLAIAWPVQWGVGMVVVGSIT